MLLRAMAGFFGRLLARLFGRKEANVAQPGLGIPAPHTLVARVGGLADNDERAMIRVAEESLRRGFPEQAAIAYRKAAHRFKKEGKHLQRIAVLRQLAKVTPDDPRAHLELIEVCELIDRKRDADLSRLAAAEIMRRHGQHQEAGALEAQVAPRVIGGRSASMMSTHPNELDGVDEMPGDSVPLIDAADSGSHDALPPVMPVDIGAPGPSLEPALPPRGETASLTMSKLESRDPLDLSLDDIDLDDEEEDAEAALDLHPSAVFDAPAPVAPAPVLAPVAYVPTAPGLAIDATDTASDELDVARPDDAFDGDQTMAYSSVDVPALRASDLEIVEDEADLGDQTIAYSAFDDVTADGGYDARDLLGQTIGMSSLDQPTRDPAELEHRLFGDVGDEDDEDFGVDPGAQTIAIGAVSVGGSAANLIDRTFEEDDDDAGTMLGTLEAETEEHEDLDPGAQTIAVPSIPHTRDLPRNVRFNIDDAATQMDPRGVPGAVVGTEHEVRARAESRMGNIQDAKTQAYDDEIARALRSKIGG